MIYNFYEERGPPRWLLITLVLLFFVINITNSQPSEPTEVSRTEDDPSLRIIQGDSFIDGSLCLRLVKFGYNSCYEPILHSRITNHNDNSVLPITLNTND